MHETHRSTRLAAACLAAGFAASFAAFSAHAAQARSEASADVARDNPPWVNVSFVNHTPAPFDFSLQMANYGVDAKFSNLLVFGKTYAEQITPTPILPPGASTDWQRYTYNQLTHTYDAISLNLRLADGSKYGMRSFPGIHTCDIPDSMNGNWVLLNLQPDGSPYTLYEQFSDGEVCAFGINSGYSHELISPPEAAPRTVKVSDPALLRRLDADFQRATGIDPGQARAARQAATASRAAADGASGGD